MLKTRFLLSLFISAMFFIAACSSSQAPGKWTVIKPDNSYDSQVHENLSNTLILSANFVNENAGWINGWRGQYDKSGSANANTNRSANTNRGAKPKKDEEPKIMPSLPNDGYIVLQTSDGGVTWNEMPGLVENKIRSVWFVDPSRGWAITTDRNIVSTSDGGATWAIQREARTTKATIYMNQRDVPEQIEHIRFADNQHGWAWGGGKKEEAERDGRKITTSYFPGIFLVTLDGGQNWAEVPYPFEREVVKSFFLNFRYGWANIGGGSFYKTADGGLNWTKIDTKLPQIVLRSIFFIDENNGWVVDGDGRMAKTTDGGATWRKLWEVRDEFKIHDIYFTADGRGWAAGENGVLLYTTDGETRWLLAERPVASKLTTIAFTDANHGWAVGSDGVMLRYENQ
jgi:photosystem II stability/assembly factor-like uncharacterized protein